MITCLALSVSLDVTYLVERLEVGEIHRPTGVLKLPGGKALNAARAIATLGRSVRAIAVLGGHTGALIEDMLIGSGIDLRVSWAERETRSCVTVATTTELTEFYERSAPLEAGVWDALEPEIRALDDSDWLVVSGSIAPGIDLVALADSLAGCRARGIKVALDTHGAALSELIRLVRPDLVKVNRVEAAELLGVDADADLAELAGGIQSRTGELVVLTDGASGAVATEGGAIVSVGGPAKAGRYPVGSGDCFLGGFLVALDSGGSIEDALALGASCAEANAAVPGAAIFDALAVTPLTR